MLELSNPTESPWANRGGGWRAKKGAAEPLHRVGNQSAFDLRNAVDDEGRAKMLGKKFGTNAVPLIKKNPLPRSRRRRQKNSGQSDRFWTLPCPARSIKNAGHVARAGAGAKILESWRRSRIARRRIWV